MKQTDTHYYFLTNFLSNFNRPINGIEVTREEFEKSFPDIKLPDDFSCFNFRTTEHIFMWIKALFFKDFETAATILVTAAPMAAKNLGRQVKNFVGSEWDQPSIDAMYFANRLRFKQNPYQLKQLKDTYPKKLVECNGSDRVWAIGLDIHDPKIFDEKNWDGENRLGKCHERLRDEL